MLTYGDHYMTSQIIVENHLAGCFEYFKCQQMAPMAQLYSWQITKVCLQTIKIFNTAHQMILHNNSRSLHTLVEENRLLLLKKDP